MSHFLWLHPVERRLKAIFVGLLLTSLAALPLAAAESSSLHVGVVQGTPGQWGWMCDYLAQRIPGQAFTLVELPRADLHQALRTRQIDFLVAPPPLALAAMPAGLDPIPLATAKTGNGRWRVDMAGVLLVPMVGGSIKEPADLAGKRIAIAARDDYAWLMVRHALRTEEIDPGVVGSVLFEKGNADGVLRALLAKEADAGMIKSQKPETITL